MGYDNVLFNGKSMRNAIITKLSEDKHLTAALFANSNITILIDILSYMYQCLMSNLRQAASESMWSDTIFFENANRLARLIGYYAKGQIPFTMLAKLIPPEGSENVNAPDFGEVTLSYGPYEYRFAVVEHDINHDQSLVRLALGEWKLLYNSEPDKSNYLISDGTKFQEFIVENHIGDEDMPAYISQKYVRVFTVDENKVAKEWKYSPNPLFLIQDNGYEPLDAEGAIGSRTLIASEDDPETRYFNFYINENGDYVIKFGDGLSTAIPKEGSRIFIFYVSATETEATITQAIKSAIANSTSTNISQFTENIDDTNQSIYDFFTNLLNAGDENITCLPITTLSGYRKRDTAETIRQNSRAAFSRQNRLVTKEDYRSFLLENFSEWVDIAVQNNWEYISSFYGWLYAIQQNFKKKAKKAGVEANNEILTVNKLQKFNSSDLADANNVYIWVLKEDIIDPNTIDLQDNIGIITDTENGINAKFGNSLGAIKDITEHPIFLNALCKRFMPFAGTLDETEGKINFDNPNPFENFASYFRIHVDSNYATNLNSIKAKTINYFKSYLFDNIKLGYTPNISALIKDLMTIDGVINVTTVFNSDKNGSIETEQEVNGMRFCTWTDTNNELLSASDDADVGFNLPNIPCFQYFKSAQTYDDFIQNSLKFKVDYSLKS